MDSKYQYSSSVANSTNLKKSSSVNAYTQKTYSRFVLCKTAIYECRNHLHHLGLNVSKYIHEIHAVCEECSLHSAENETQCDTSKLNLTRSRV